MAVNVNTNVAAMTAQRYLNNANSARSNFERTTWFSETSETVISENQLENSSWQ
ncbi:Flagellin D [Vibrio vulnificus]|nr:Flagellin D [Vibrio vulnificus]